jgi:glycosyltransferase involved in cell wall biosynthesis
VNILIVGLGGVTHTFRHWPERVLALALQRRGHTVWAIGTHDRRRPALATRHEVIDGVEVFRVKSAYWPNRELARALAQGPRPDVVHLLHPRNVLAAQTTRWAQQHDIPTVYTWLGPFHDEYATPDRERPYDVAPTWERLAFTRKTMLRQLLLEHRPRDVLRNYRLHWPLKAATALIPCSSFEATIMRRFGLTQPQVVVPLWLDLPFIQATPLQPPSLEHPRPWILFVGQLTTRKGYDLAIQALPSIVAAYPTASLLIVSGINQAQRTHTLHLARQSGVENHVHILGYLSDEELINLYRASDALLFPTRFEGFGLPLLEAMAAQCPVITTNIPVVNEIVRDGENGLLVPYNDANALAQAVLRLTGNPALRTRLIEGGKTTLHTRYNEETLIRQIEHMYRQCIE